MTHPPRYLISVIRTNVVLNIQVVMLRLSKLTDYAVGVLGRLSGDALVQTSTGIAATTGGPEPTVAKVLKALAGKGLVISQRGARGGYRLARSLDDIAVAEVIEAIDGPIAITTCVDGAGGCEAERLCPIRGRWDPVNSAVRDALRTITLGDMRSTPPTKPRPPDAVRPATPIAQMPAE